MSTTAWERRDALADVVRGVWDARRGQDSASWEANFEAAREATARRLERDAATVRAISWEEFQRLQKITSIRDGESAP